MIIDRRTGEEGAITLKTTTLEMSCNAAMLTKIAEMEAALADMRSMLADPSAPTTPVKAKAARVPGAPMKAGAKSLSEADMDAMVCAGVKVGAQIKTLGKAVFGPLSIPEYLWEDSREQWKEYRSAIPDDEAEALASEPVLTEEICEALKDCTDAKTKKPFDATTRTKKLAGELADHDIHPVLFDRAGKEWREWAEAHGLGKRAKAPPQSSRSAKAPKATKEALPALLTADMLASIRDSTDKHGKAFHAGSQKRMLADTLTGLGIAEADHARAAKEWKEYAKAEGITRESSPAGSAKASSKGSDGVPEELSEGVGPAMPEAPASPKPAAAAAKPASPKPAAAAKPAASSGKILKPAQLAAISQTFSTNPMPSLVDIRKVLRLHGVPHAAFTKAAAEWRKWAEDNHRVTEEDTEVDLGLDE